MPDSDQSLRLEHILDAIAKIERYTAGLTFETFAADEKTIDAVLRNLEIIGEAARNVPENVQEQHPEIPWDKMRDIRNVLIHEYFGISLSIIWETIKHDLPPLVMPLRGLLQE